MRAATRAYILLASLCLLALATSASAECMWVLWGKNPSTGTYYVDSAYETKMECKRVAAARNNQSTKAVADHRCLPVGVQPGASGLPDTVDPRAPKTK